MLYGMEELYEPDEILRDVDTGLDASMEDDIDEMNFETEHEASEAMALLIEDVGASEEQY